MPHSGGGGSHGGGSHGGSHHGGSASSNRVSRTYFPGAHRYLYYYNHEPHYYYANRKDVPAGKATGIFLIIFSIMWLLMTVPAVLAAISSAVTSGPLPQNYDTSTVIEDELGLIDNRLELTQIISGFREKTGVTLSVVILKPENAFHGDSYTNQAYNCYVSHWDDESHWLIYYVGSKKDRSDNWHWELMCGNDCTKILSSSIEDSFTKEFHRYLVAADRYSFTSALKTAINGINVTPGAVNWEELLFMIPFLLFPIVGVCIFLGGLKTIKDSDSPLAKAKTQAVEIAPNIEYREIKCDYCSGVYVQHTCTSCPHCGAPVKILDDNGASPT